MWVHISSSATGEKGAATMQEPLLASCQVRRAMCSCLNMDGEPSLYVPRLDVDWLGKGCDTP